MSHGGNPEAGTSSFVGIDGTGLVTASPGGPETWVIPVSDSFTVAMSWKLTGVFAPWLAGLGLSYTVTYRFAGLGHASGVTHTVSKATVPGQTVYESPETVVTVAAGSLPAGPYEVLATVTFGGHPPMSAFIAIPVLDICPA